MSEEALYVMARKESRLGVPVAVTPPDRDSDRYKRTVTNKFALKEVLMGDEFSLQKLDIRCILWAHRIKKTQAIQSRISSNLNDKKGTSRYHQQL